MEQYTETRYPERIIATKKKIKILFSLRLTLSKNYIIAYNW